MAPTPEKIIEYLRTIGTDFTDCRVVTELEMRALVWFFTYGENVLSQVGQTWRGCSFRQAKETCLMVMKGGTKEVPRVAFVTDRNPVGCVVAFCKLWHGDRVKWVDDQYA